MEGLNKEKNMGTWARQRDKIPAVIREIEDFKKRIFRIAGDDCLFDHLQRAITRLKELDTDSGNGESEPIDPDIH